MNQKGIEKEPWFPSQRVRGPLLRRVIVVVLLLDLSLMVVFVQEHRPGGDLWSGFYWPYPGKTLFPVPIDLGSWIPMTEPLNPVDQFVYAVFIWNGIWVAWTAVALVYIVYPLLRKQRFARKKA